MPYIKTIVILCILIVFPGCFSLSLKDYNPFAEDSSFIPGKEHIETTYTTQISDDWSTAISIGPEAEYVNVGFQYSPEKAKISSYEREMFDELGQIINRKYPLSENELSDIKMTNLWCNVYRFNLNKNPVTFRWKNEQTPRDYVSELMVQKLYWYASMRMISKVQDTTLSTQRNFVNTPEKAAIDDLKKGIMLFPYLTAAKLSSTTNYNSTSGHFSQRDSME